MSLCWVASPVQAATVKIPMGTPVILNTTAPLSPATLHVGDVVNLTVAQDVSVDGKVIIKAGATAMGDVTTSSPRNYLGIPGKIGISLRSVTAVDGNMIPINASKLQEGEDKMIFSIGLSLICCILFVLKKGGEASIAAGTTINATTSSSMEIAI